MNKYEKLQAEKIPEKTNSLITVKDLKSSEFNKIDDSAVALVSKDIEKGDSIKVHPLPSEK